MKCYKLHTTIIKENKHKSAAFSPPQENAQRERERESKQSCQSIYDKTI
jgi:hypothetical protein